MTAGAAPPRVPVKVWTFVPAAVAVADDVEAAAWTATEATALVDAELSAVTLGMC